MAQSMVYSALPSKRMGLLFIIVLLLSSVVHWPVSMVLSQSAVKSQLPAQLALSHQQGTLWQGQTSLAWQGASVGDVHWDWQLSGLLLGQMQTDLQWKQAASHLQTRVALPWYQRPHAVSLSNVQGVVDIASLLPFLSEPGFRVLPVQGLARVEDMQATLDLASGWPLALLGRMSIEQLDVLGNRFPSIEVHSSLLDKSVQLDVSAAENGWRMSGTVLLHPNRRYEIDLQVLAETPDAMPAWAFLLERKTENAAVIQQRGHW